jgi:hypothetical protein
LKNKCKYGNKCKFRHLNAHEILNEIEDLRRENLKEKCLELSNLNKMHYDVTESTVHALEKSLYKGIHVLNIIVTQRWTKII